MNPINLDALGRALRATIEELGIGPHGAGNVELATTLKRHLETSGLGLINRKPKVNIVAGWWVPRMTKSKPRLVLAISKTHVLYSDGQTQRECNHVTFCDWVRETEAVLGQAPEFTGLEQQVA